MAKKSSTDLLKEKIHLLEMKQAEEGQVLKAELLAVYESLKPANLLKSTVKEIASSDELKNTLFETSAALAAGFLAKKIESSGKNKLFMKFLSTLLQLGITSAVAASKDFVNEFVNNLLDRFLSTKQEDETDLAE
jgi:hypothetical protein